MGNAMIRKAVLAGSWYPGDPAVLRADVERYFRHAVGPCVAGDVVGLLAPHAGYVYSGQVAAYAYKAVQGKSFDHVVVIAPSHRKFFPGISAYPEGAYETPLGIVPVDAGLTESLIAQNPRISFSPGIHAAEHAIEIQLPFLQAALGAFILTPLIMGDQSDEACDDLAKAVIGAVGDKSALMIASSDLSHGHAYEQAVRIDKTFLGHVASMDAHALLRALSQGVSEACGGGPAATVMMIARGLGANRAEVLKYANSGDTTGDRSGVVGYAAAVFHV